MNLKIISITTIIAIFIVSMVGCKNNSTQNKIGITEKIPTIEEVGAKALPDVIKKVKAPFQTIDFQKPVFPSDTVILELKGNTINTSAINQAINQLSEKGGGIILVPKGEWHTGRIELKSNINLHFEEGSIIKFSGEINDFLPVVFTRVEGIEVMSLGACIYANEATNIAITGKGKLIGPGEGSIRNNIMTHDVIENVVDLSLPVSKRIVDGKQNPWIFPPMFISPINCTKVYIEGISLENTAFWNIVPVYCNNVIIRGVTVNSVGVPRGDGIDIESSKNVLIEYCDLSCGDDCFTMKSGRGKDGIRVNKATENVVVRYCLALHGHGGITCGSETAGMIRNLYVHDCVFNDVGVGIRFKTRRPRGGGGENLTYERIRMNLRYTAIKWDMLGSPKHVGELANRLPARKINDLTPRYTDINMKNILIEKASQFVKVIGIPESPVSNVVFENIEAHCSKLIMVQDMNKSTFQNINITAGDTIIFLTDTRNTSFKNINFNTSAPVTIDISGEMTDSIEFNTCLGIKNNTWIKGEQ